MPNGVNVIEVIPIMTNNFCLNLMIVSFIIYVILEIIALCYFTIIPFFYDYDGIDRASNFSLNYIIKSFIIELVIVLILGIISLLYKPDYTGRNQYKVEISDSASFNEVYNNYKIIEQDNNIYLIEEKENNND